MPARRVQNDAEIHPSSESCLSDYSSDADSSGSEQEVTLNILEREKRVTAGMSLIFPHYPMLFPGKRAVVLAGDDEEKDRTFWGSEEHNTWEESESDSDVSYDLNDSEDESESDPELDEVEGEEESEEENSEEEEDSRRKRPRFQAYKVPPKDGATVKKAIVRKLAPPKSQETPKEAFERRETRETTRARTLEVTEGKPSGSKRKKRSSSGVLTKLSQEELMEEAKIVEEWNKADYDAYLRYTEMSEKERNALVQKRRTQGPKNVYKIVSRSYIADGKSVTELRIVPPVVEESSSVLKSNKKGFVPKSVREVLNLDQTEPKPADKSFKYRYPYGEMSGYNTAEEFAAIRDKEMKKEALEAQAVIDELNLLLGNK